MNDKLQTIQKKINFIAAEIREHKIELKLKIKEGNPKYKGKPICKDCQDMRKLLLSTK